MNWLQKLADVRLLYHGTNDARWLTIQSEGLNEEHERVWDADWGEASRMQSIEAFNGIYFTSNYTTANSSARNAVKKDHEQGGDSEPLIIMAQIETGTPTVTFDEDYLREPDGVIATVIGFLTEAYKFVVEWMYEGFPNLDRAVELYIQELEGMWQVTLDHRVKQYIRQDVAEMIKAWAFKHVGRAVELRRFEPLYSLPPEQKEFVDTIDANQANAEYRSHASDIIDKLKGLVNTGQDNHRRENIRIREPVGFRGRNKIVLAVQVIRDYEPYYRLLLVRYQHPDKQVVRQAISQLIRDVSTREGPEFKLEDRRTGEVFHDQPKKPR